MFKQQVKIRFVKSLIVSSFKDVFKNVKREGYDALYSVVENNLLKSNKLIQLRFTSTEVGEEMDYLIRNEYRDYFDFLIFSTASIENTMLITEDNELRNI